MKRLLLLVTVAVMLAMTLGTAGQAIAAACKPACEGTEFPDNIEGDDDPNLIHGYGGNDVIHGNGGNDELRGNGGNDRIYGEEGNDKLIGGNGDDYLDGGPVTTSYETPREWKATAKRIQTNFMAKTVTTT